MTKSMTGYGKGEASGPAGRITAEIRSVNHRYGEITVKLPRTLLQYEAGLRKQVAERLKRGKIEVFIQLDELTGEAGRPTANLPLAKGYYAAFTAIREALGLAEPVSLALIAAQKDVLTSGSGEPLDASIGADLTAAVGEALDRLEAMRGQEGEALRSEVEGRMAALGAQIERIALRAPQVVTACGEKIRERLSRLLPEGAVDEGRLAQEIAIIADRLDITEELVRLQSHRQQFFATLGLAEPVGRKLDFLLQEINREVNTIGSKANDGEVTALVVEIKAELEKVREQVQNLE